MQRNTLSARAAALSLGFKSANPILDAIRAGELPAQQRPARRNGGAGNFQIQQSDLDAWAIGHGYARETLGVEPEAPDPAEDYGPILPAEPISNVSRLVALPTPAGMVTLPIEHYAALVAARAELEFIRREFELTWKGKHATSSDAAQPAIFATATDPEVQAPAGRVVSKRRRA